MQLSVMDRKDIKLPQLCDINTSSHYLIIHQSQKFYKK